MVKFHNGTIVDTRSETGMNRLFFKFVWNRPYCFGLGFEYYTIHDTNMDLICKVLRFDFLVFSLNFTLYSSAWRKAEWSNV